MNQATNERTAPVQWWALTVDCPDPPIPDFYLALYRPPTWPSSEAPLHCHFDYVVDDPEAVARDLLPLGGTLAAQPDDDNPNMLVLLDPAGHPFCLLRSSAARRF